VFTKLDQDTNNNNTAANTHANSGTNHDKDKNHSRHIIGTDHAYMSEGSSKNRALFKIMQINDYAHDQILYVDNVKSVIEYFNSIALCRTVLVKEEYGIGASTCAEIENMFDENTATVPVTLKKTTQW